jgi:hypothetical protein
MLQITNERISKGGIDEDRKYNSDIKTQNRSGKIMSINTEIK